MTPQEIKTTLLDAMLSHYGSVVAFSNYSGIHRNTISTALSEERDPRLSTLTRIAGALDKKIIATGARGIDGDMLTVPDALNLRRKQLDITIQELANTAGISATAAAALSTGRADPQISTLCKIATALGMKLHIDKSGWVPL